jgi:hypothetical protein
MENRDFIYHFTNILFSEIVKETILIENWKESDFDYRYAEYINIFQNMLNACVTRGSTDEILCKRLHDSKKTMIKLFNGKMRADFCKSISRSGNVSAPADLLPAGLFDDDKINVEILKIFRKFEEETFTRRVKGGNN